MTIVILGAGVQGTLYGVRLARAGHSVTFVARGKRAVLAFAGDAAGKRTRDARAC